MISSLMSGLLLNLPNKFFISPIDVFPFPEYLFLFHTAISSESSKLFIDYQIISIVSFSFLKMFNNCLKSLSVFILWVISALVRFVTWADRFREVNSDALKVTWLVVVEEGIQPSLLIPDPLCFHLHSLSKLFVMTLPWEIYHLREVLWINKQIFWPSYNRYNVEKTNLWLNLGAFSHNL